MMLTAPAAPPVTTGGNYTCPGWQGINPACRIGEGFDSALDSASSSVVASVAQAVKQGEVDILNLMTKMWLSVQPNIPNPPQCSSTTITAANCPGPTGFLRQNTQWIVVYLAVFSLIFAAGQLAWTRRAEPAREAVRAIITLVIVTGASTGVAFYAVDVGNNYSHWILDKAASQSGGGGFANQLNNHVNVAAGGLSDMLMIVIGLLGIIASIVQLILMFVRIAMLGLVFGLLPIPAAFSNTPEGRAFTKKLIGWGIAFLLYEPTASTAYAYSFVSFKSTDTTDQLAGLVMIVLAVATLPALLRFINPMVAPATGGGSGAGAALAGAGVAMGARSIPSFRRGSSGGGGGGTGGGSGGGGSDAASSAPSGSQRAGSSGGQNGSAPTPPPPSGSGGNNAADASGAQGGQSSSGGTAGASSGGASGGTAGASSAGGASGGAGAAGGAAGGIAGVAVTAAKQKVDQFKAKASEAVEGPDGSK